MRVKRAKKRQEGAHPSSLVVISANGKYGFSDMADNVAVKPKYDDVGKFADGLAEVCSDLKCGYMDV